MTQRQEEQRQDKVRRFLELHKPGAPFILANAHDVGSARLLAATGAVALATTSAGYAFTRGAADMGNIRGEEMLTHAAELAAATTLPLSADLENGYGDSPDEVAATVRAAQSTGLSGCSVEDVLPPDGLAYDFSTAVARIEAAADAAVGDFVLTARADGMMCGRYNLDEAIRRLRAFESVGANVLYAPCPPDMQALAKICRAVSAPVNALAAGEFCNYKVSDFGAAGVARISLGSSLSRITHAVILKAARKMFASGDFSPLLNAASGDEVDKLLEKGRGV